MTFKNPLNKLLILVILFQLFSTTNVYSKTDKKTKQPTISLKNAIKKKYVSVIISGYSAPSFFQDIIDKDGLHFGKCMTIVIQCETNKPFIIELKAGTELVPDDSTFQTMIVTKTVNFPINSGSYYGTRFYAMCGEMHDLPPYVNSFYTVGNFADKNIVRLANYLDENYIQNMLGQHALWAYSDKATIKDLIKYGADSNSIKLSAEILNKIDIKTNINKKLKLEKVKNKENDSNLITIILGSLSLIFFTTSLILFAKKNKSKDFDSKD
jgi:hypothetical protein